MVVAAERKKNDGRIRSGCMYLSCSLERHECAVVEIMSSHGM